MVLPALAPLPKASTESLRSPKKGDEPRLQAKSGATIRGNSQLASRGSTKLKNGNPSKAKNSNKTHRRSRTGCFTCRLRRKKCEEGKPACKACRNLKLKCEYTRPIWWTDEAERAKQKRWIKEYIRHNKMAEKAEAVARVGTVPPNIPLRRMAPRLAPILQAGSVGPASIALHGHGQYLSNAAGSQCDSEWDSTQYPALDFADPFGSARTTPESEGSIFMPGSVSIYPRPTDLDFKVVREDSFSDADSSIRDATVIKPGISQLSQAFPFVGWVDQPATQLNETNCDPQFSAVNLDIDSDDDLNVPDDEWYLITYFLDTVLRLVFPVLGAGRHDSIKRELFLPSIQNNKSFRHCCLTAAALHLKATQSGFDEQVDHQIMRHSYEAVKELCEALQNEKDYEEILESTLGMLVFHSAIGEVDGPSPGIPWHGHFQAASDLIQRSGLPKFMLGHKDGSLQKKMSHNMSLFAWIDILGSTMLCTTPKCAHVYRKKFLAGTTTGLKEMMGCEDRVMYLISEIACLDSLQCGKRVNNIELCGHITSLAQQLDNTEQEDRPVAPCYRADGSINTGQLATNITAIFRVAARVYLCSLVPGFEREQVGANNLISHLALDLLPLIPSGPEGYDRAIVWPLMLCASYALPESPLRTVFWQRVELAGEQACFGNIYHMKQLVSEIWRLADLRDADTQLRGQVNGLPGGFSEGTPLGIIDPAIMAQDTSTQDVETIPADVGFAISAGTDESIDLATFGAGSPIHWRDVMRHRGWDFLLI